MNIENETITTEIESDVLSDDWDEIDLSDAKDEGDEEVSETAEQEEADHSEVSKEAEKPEETETETKAEEDADQRFTLKHLGEVKEYNREETLALAQKGLDYDRIRQKLSEKEEAEKQHKDILAFVSELAGSKNVSVDEFMLDYRAMVMAQKEQISVDSAKERLQMQAREKALTERENALKEREEAQKSADTKRETVQQDFAAFFKARPGVKAEDIPKEVYQQALDGTPLLTAYTVWENAKLKAELEAERKNKANAEKATGSTSSAGKKPKRDAFDEAWYDGT